MKKCRGERPIAGRNDTNTSARRTCLSQDELDVLSRQYSIALKRYFIKRGCQPATADDLVQDVLVRLAGRVSSSEIENAEAYLMQTASSVWKDFLRRRKIRAHGDHVEFEEFVHGREEVSPERVYEGRETIQRVLAALRELDERPRQIFFLCRFEGMKHHEVAKRLGVSVSFVEKGMMKAIAHLADRFGDG